MKFRLVEDIHEYYRCTLYDTDTEEYVSLFRGLGEYLEELGNSDDTAYEDMNYALSQLEYVLDVPAELDFKNINYNFAFTKKAFDVYKDEFNELKGCLEEYSPYKLIITEIDLDDKEIVYKDDLQVAYEI